MPRFGIPDHTNPPVHAPLNPTDPYRPPPPEPQWQPVSRPPGGGATTVVFTGPVTPARKSLWVAALLALLLGPLGLFYVGVWHGLAALVLLPVALPALLREIAAHQGVSYPSLIPTLGLPLAWIILIGWALVAARIRNARIAE